MSLDVGDALEEGFHRATRRNGLLVMLVFLVTGLAMTVLLLSATRQFLILVAEQFGNLESVPRAELQTALAEANRGLRLDLSPLLLLGLLFGVYVLEEALKIGVIRTFMTDETDRLELERFTRRVPRTLVHLIVGGVLYFLAVGVGLLLLIVPGIYLAVALFFYNFEIIVEEKSAIEGLRGSWAVTRGHRLALFGLGLVVAALSYFSTTLAGIVGARGTVPNILAQSVIGAGITVFGIATATMAYRQLRGESPAGGADEDESVGALDAEDLA